MRAFGIPLRRAFSNPCAKLFAFVISCEKKEHNSDCGHHLDCREASKGVVYLDRKTNSFNTLDSHGNDKTFKAYHNII